MDWLPTSLIITAHAFVMIFFMVKFILNYKTEIINSFVLYLNFILHVTLPLGYAYVFDTFGERTGAREWHVDFFAFFPNFNLKLGKKINSAVFSYNEDSTNIKKNSTKSYEYKSKQKKFFF